ncbi:hypothetical protein Tco_0389146 [Tanacetum coccineum]
MRRGVTFFFGFFRLFECDSLRFADWVSGFVTARVFTVIQLINKSALCHQTEVDSGQLLRQSIAWKEVDHARVIKSNLGISFLKLVKLLAEEIILPSGARFSEISRDGCRLGSRCVFHPRGEQSWVDVCYWSHAADPGHKELEVVSSSDRWLLLMKFRCLSRTLRSTFLTHNLRVTVLTDEALRNSISQVQYDPPDHLDR